MAEQVTDQTKANMRAQGYDIDQLVQQAQASVQSGAAMDLMAMSQRSARLLSAGIEMPAVVRTIAVGAPSALTGAGVPVTVGVTVQPPAASPYEAAAQQVMVADLANQLHEGASVTVRVAPDDPQTLMIWGVTDATPVAPTAPASGEGDRIARLTKLQSLHSSGAITDAEFEEQTARILAE
jgi:hypothetical protein